MKAEFEEKDYEAPLYSELRFGISSIDLNCAEEDMSEAEVASSAEMDIA